jgi:hypothetical protein
VTRKQTVLSITKDGRRVEVVELESRTYQLFVNGKPKPEASGIENLQSALGGARRLANGEDPGETVQG